MMISVSNNLSNKKSLYQFRIDPILVLVVERRQLVVVVVEHRLVVVVVVGMEQVV
jgi:hypothetical protein